MTAALTYGGAIPLPTIPMIPQLTAGSVRHMPMAVSGTGATLDAAGEKLAMIGRVTWKDRATHTISSAGGKIHWSAGSAVTWADAGTALDVGIQDVANTSQNPDGTFDVKATLVPGTEAIAATTIINSAMETGTKTIANGAVIGVVFDMTARGGTDSVRIATTQMNGWSGAAYPYCRFHNATAWTNSFQAPNVLLEADDGVKGWFAPFGLLRDSFTITAFNLNTAGSDEYGGRIKLPWPVTLEAVTMPVRLGGTSSDWELCVYSDIAGTPTLLGTAETFDASNSDVAAHDFFETVMLTTPFTLSAGTVYGITARPTTANNISVETLSFGTGNNGLMAYMMMGVESYQITRLNNTGVFTLDDTIHFPMILHVSKFDDGAGGSGGGLRLAGHGGLAA